MSANPDLIERARATLQRRIGRYGARPPAALLEWRALLERPWSEVAARAAAPVIAARDAALARRTPARA